MPTLIVDDECDQASLNTQAYKNSVSRINNQIRGLLDSELLPKVTYLGYTATPYANVLTAECGLDGTRISIQRTSSSSCHAQSFTSESTGCSVIIPIQ